MTDVAAVAPRAATVLTRTGLRRGGRWQQVYIPVKNEQGELLKIDKHQLSVDPAYQRRVDVGRVSRYAANWSWISCGSLIVSRRTEGATYFIVDGQHRWEAAKLIDHVRDLPCLAFPLDLIRDEAIGFLAANTERKLPGLADQFKALIIAENEDAILADRLARIAGRHIAGGTGPYTISCASEFLRLIQTDRDAVEEVWPALSQLCQGYAMSHKILRGVVGLQRRLSKKQSLAIEGWGGRLVRVGWIRVDEEIRRIGQIERNYSERSCARGVLAAINRGLSLKLEADLDRNLR